VIYYSLTQNLISLFLIPLTVSNYTNSKLFFAFLKIGALLYGNGYVVYAYLDDTLVRSNHWLTEQQLIDVITVGQITPGPILSSATFAGFLIGGFSGAVLATIGIFLPSFFISFFMKNIQMAINKYPNLRNFFDSINGASVALIALIASKMIANIFHQWQAIVIFAFSVFILVLFRVNVVMMLLLGSGLGALLFIFFPF
jgi:chromate transporter